MEPVKFGKTFHLLNQEAYLARTALLNGLDDLRRANLGSGGVGAFYSSFFQLSIGLERLMKIILIVDHMGNNQLEALTNRQLKEQYGHQLLILYQSCMKLHIVNNLTGVPFPQEKSLEHEILLFLHTFAISTRYYNLAQLTSVSPHNDPLEDWWTLIKKVANLHISKKKLQQIQFESEFYSAVLGDNTYVLFHGLDKELLVHEEAYRYPRIIEAAAPYYVWLTICLIAPLYDLLSHVVAVAHNYQLRSGLSTPSVPYLTEFFSFLLLERKSVLRRKRWRDITW